MTCTVPPSRISLPRCLLVAALSASAPLLAQDAPATPDPTLAAPPEDALVIPGRPVLIKVPPYNPANPPIPLHQSAPVPVSPTPPSLPTPPLPAG